MHAHHHAKPAPFVPPVVRLDGVEIPPAEIAAEMQHHPAASPEGAWHAAAEALVLKRVLLAEAARLGLDAVPGAEETAEEARIRRLLDAEIRVPEADEATCRRWFDANPSRFRTKEAWHAAHILLAADPADEVARGHAESEAAMLLLELQRDPEAFASLARAHSACPSREADGDLGLVEEGSTVAEFEAALRRLAPGQTHVTPVASRYGFHVLRLHRHEPGRALPYAAVRARIAGWLQEGAWRRAVRQYMALLAARARLEGLVLSAGADGPLVQ